MLVCRCKRRSAHSVAMCSIYIWLYIYIYLFVPRAKGRYHTPTTAHPTPISHPATGDVIFACYKWAVFRAARETYETQVRQSYKWELFRVASATFASRSPEQARLLSQFGRIQLDIIYIYMIWYDMIICRDTDMTSHLPPSPLRVCWYAAFPLRWLGALPKPAYFVTRVFTASFYVYVDR